MPVFEAYSRYYDLFYRDKDYGAEARFVLERLEAHSQRPRSILDLGCGTGMHCREFAAEIPDVLGVDRSEGMIGEAKHLMVPEVLSPRYHLGDVRDVRLGRTVDAVVSLFHVVSYQTENSHLARTFATAHEHLAPGGLFLFDFWHGPTVLSDPPRVRIKRVEDERTSVTRICEPLLDHRACTVDVRYTVLVRDVASGLAEELHESHHMRYLFEPEIAQMAAACGFSVVETAPWMAPDRPVRLDDFSVYTILRRLT